MATSNVCKNMIFFPATDCFVFYIRTSTRNALKRRVVPSIVEMIGNIRSYPLSAVVPELMIETGIIYSLDTNLKDLSPD